MLRVKSNTAAFNHDENRLTKRTVISAMAQVYDPNGLVTPVIVGNKILQQDLWRSGKGWDERIPAELLPQWHDFVAPPCGY